MGKENNISEEIQRLLREGDELYSLADEYDQVTDNRANARCRGWITAAVRALEKMFPSGTNVYRKEAEKIARNSAGFLIHHHVAEIADILKRVQEDTPNSPPVLLTRAATHDVFVIHGRNARLRDSMFQLLRAFGLNPMEWSEMIAKTGKATPYIGEILDAGFSAAGAVVALLTPDDLACLHPSLLEPQDKDYERRQMPQARPNVLFETGLAFGRHPERTIIVQIGDLRPFSDISGMHILMFDGSPKVRQELKIRLSTAGCPVRESGSDWLSVGDFGVGLAEVEAEQPAEPIRAPESYQLQVIRGFIRQMGVNEMWLSQIFARGITAFDGIPAGRGMVDYPVSLHRLADLGEVDILESKNRRYVVFQGDEALVDYRFRVKGILS